MNTKDSTGDAFPKHQAEWPDMSYRMWLVGQALAVCAERMYGGGNGEVAKDAVALADAIIRELSKES